MEDRENRCHSEEDAATFNGGVEKLGMIGRIDRLACNPRHRANNDCNLRSLKVLRRVQSHKENRYAGIYDGIQIFR